MAEKTVQKFEDQLNCSICLDTYTDPKLLQCFHVYCQKCLVKLVVQDQHGQLSLTCPICQQNTPVPANGVAGLQPACQINHFLEIMKEHKKATADPSASEEKVEPVSTSLTSPDKIKVCCREHDGKEVELYCETCGEPICVKCALKGGKHHDHDCEELDTAFQQYKKEITASLEPMEKQLTTITKALAQLDTRCGEISDQRAVVESDVHDTFERLQVHLQEALDIRKTELISQLHQITQGKLKGLAVQRDQMETTQAQLSSCLGFMKESLKTGSQEEVLLMKTMVVKQVKELTTTLPPDTLKPNAEADIVFSTSADLTAVCKNYGRVRVSAPGLPDPSKCYATGTAVCKNYGQVSAPGLPDPSKCHATGKGVEVAVVGEMSTAVLQVINFKNQPCKEPIKSSECELVSEITGARTQGSIKRRGQSQYEISYQPTIKGRHQLHVKVKGQRIRGSPFSVAAKSPVKMLGTPILTIAGVIGSYGVAINQRGEAMITERGACCVSVFSPSGERLRSFGTRGSGEGQFVHPRGVAFDGEGNLLVVDSSNNRIQKFTVEGQFLAAVGTKGSGPLQFDRPYGIAFNACNRKVYVTNCNDCVQILNSDLTFSSTFGKRGRGNGEFRCPSDIACDSTGKVYVTDYSNHRVQVFTAEGKFLRMFGRRGKGKLNCPFSIAIGTNDLVYVGEDTNCRVSVFTSGGVFVTAFGSKGDQPRQFQLPCGIAVDNSGVVYVCDCVKQTLQFF